MTAGAPTLVPAAGLLARLSRLRAQAAELVERRSADDPTAGDPLRGLYLSEEAIRHLLRRSAPRTPGTTTTMPTADGDDPLARLAARFGLVALDVHILLAALAPELDRSFEPLYGYLNDDVGRRRATTGLALDLCGLPVHEPAARARFHPSEPLTALGLLVVEELERPFPSRSLRVPDRVAAHLLGDDTLDAALTGHVRTLAPTASYATEFTDKLAALLTAKAPTVYLREHREGDGLACVTAALHAAGLEALHFSGPDERIPDLLREARLSGRVVVVSPVSDQPAALVRALTGPDVSDVPVLLTGSRPYDPLWSEDDPLILETPRQRAGQVNTWGDALRGSPGPADSAPDVLNRDAPDSDALNQDALDSAEPSRDGLNPDALSRHAPGSGALSRGPLGRDALSRGALNWDALGPDDSDPDVLSRDAPGSGALGRDALSRDAPDTGALGRDAVNRDAPDSGALSRVALNRDAPDSAALNPTAPDPADPSPAGPDLGFDLAATVAPYRLGVDHIARAARAAQRLAGFDGTPLTAAHLRLAARQQSASGLERHARRIRPDVGWEDLVLPGKPLAQLRELALRARHRDQVLGEWRLSAGGGRGRGVLGLFAGESGTGKTLSAEVVAAELGLDLYVVQLSSIVDKYVGETEKNLERIFTEADRTDAVLLFDEADAVFGKRSEVKDAHDKYANMESAYLLQRLESFDGIALLTTNLRANIDEAFTRRLDLVVDFPFPDPGQRLALWRHSLARVPCAPGTDPARVADAFELAGGSIRSAVVTAAYSAAGRGESVTTADLVEGAEREYRKAGRLVPGEGSW
ncbi:ATP-binding protein [Streptomyces sp. NPDC002680]|uniref:ATP-binding protein n=1 Tax=Streptomyces sp. NPDC002680 TaxID=3364659 RepID=UPI0036ABC8F1